jgi:hypothetical protein
MPQWRGKKKGGSRFKSGLKIVVMGGMLLLEYAQVFPQGERGDRRPQFPVWSVGVSTEKFTQPLS